MDDGVHPSWLGIIDGRQSEATAPSQRTVQDAGPC